MNNIRDYIFYRIYNGVIKRGKTHEEAKDSAVIAVLTTYIPIVEALFFLAEGIIKFDMTEVTRFYLTHKKEIGLCYLMVGSVFLYFMFKKYDKKIAKGWIKELKKKYHKETYCISAVWIMLLPYIMILVVPIIYGAIMGTLEWFPNRK